MKLRNIGRIMLVAAAFLTAQIAVMVSAEPAHAAVSVGPRISRGEVVARGESWFSDNVQYSQSAYYPEAGGSTTYRTDCSGFVSMAWNVAGGSLDTNALRYNGHITKVISRAELLPGDALVNPKDDNGDGTDWGPGDDSTGHVVLFTGWANDAHTQFKYIEEYDEDQDMNMGTASLSSYGSNYKAITYKGIFDDATETLSTSNLPSPSCSAVQTKKVSIPGRKDTVLSAQTCIQRYYKAGNYDYTLGVIKVSWAPSTQSDDSQSTSPDKFDGIWIHSQPQRNDVSISESRCSLTSAINAAESGTRYCHVDGTDRSPGSWSTDGFINYNTNSDGKYGLDPWYLTGSPGVTTSVQG